jgi:hypothetical protein
VSDQAILNYHLREMEFMAQVRTAVVLRQTTAQ